MRVLVITTIDRVWIDGCVVVNVVRVDDKTDETAKKKDQDEEEF